LSKIILVRHGRTAWHAQGRYAGTADVPLDDVGLEQARLVADALSDVQIDVIFSSPLSRCLALAQKVGEVKDLEVSVDDRLSEIDLGRWDGETYKDIFDKDGAILKKWTEDPTSVTIPGGESLIAVQARAMEWFKDAVDSNPHSTIMASSHGGPLRAMLAAVIGLPLGHIFRLTVDLASISIVNYRGQFSNLQVLNETCHLGEHHAGAM
jgi:alpha-ribazole phosphatase